MYELDVFGESGVRGNGGECREDGSRGKEGIWDAVLVAYWFGAVEDKVVVGYSYVGMQGGKLFEEGGWFGEGED